MFDSNTYVDVEGWSEEEVRALAEAYKAANDASIGDIEVYYGYHFMFVMNNNSVHVGDFADVLDYGHLTTQIPQSTALAAIKNTTHKEHEMTKKKVEVLVGMDTFRNAAKLILSTSDYARMHHTQTTLENQLKTHAEECVEQMESSLENQGGCDISYVGTLNYRVMLLWLDESLLELDIAVLPKRGMLFSTSLGDLGDQLTMDVLCQSEGLTNE